MAHRGCGRKEVPSGLFAPVTGRDEAPRPVTGVVVRRCGFDRRPAPFSGQLSPWPAFGTPGGAWSRSGTGSRPGWGAPHSTQMPRSLALSLLSWVLRRINSLRSGVWARWRSYSRRFSCLASSSAGVGSTRGFGVLGWGVAFFRLVVFCLALGFLVVALRGVVDFLGLTRRLGSSNGKLSTNICLLEGFIPAWAGEPAPGR